MTRLKEAMLRRLFKLLVAFFCGSSAMAEGHPMNVLFIGNSFTHMNSMPQMFEKLAVSKSIKINVVMSAKSNHTFKMHAERPDLYEDINKFRWDYVVIQGFSRELSYGPEHIDTASVPYFNQIVDSLYANNPCVKILLYMTWGYENGYHYKEELSSYEQMSDAIEQGYRYLGSIYDLPIVPVGNVWKEVRKNYPELDLYQDDEHHPTKLGSYVVACSFYSAIFRSTPLGGFASNIPEKVAADIQQTAFGYVSSHLAEYKLDRDILDVRYMVTKEGRYQVLCKANFPRAASVEWDFGDGTITDKPTAEHFYNMDGKYQVKLTIQDTCGTRVIYRNVYYSKPFQPVTNEKSKPNTKGEAVIRKKI